MKIHYFFICFLIVLYSFNSFAEILRQVKITGNVKSRNATIRRYVHKKIGEDFTESDLLKVKQRLLKLHQIHLEKIDFTNGVLNIEICDKWSLFPVPMITQSGNYYSRGMLFYENNFLGMHATFATAAAWTNSGFNGLLYFQDESFFNETVGFKMLVLRKSDLVEFERKKKILNRFESRYDTFIFTPNYLTSNQVFKLGPLLLRKSIVDDVGTKIFKREAYGLFFRHHYQNFEVMDVQYKGLVTTINTTVARDNLGKNIMLIEGDIQTSTPFASNFLNFMFQGHYSTDSSYLYSKVLGGSEGIRGYDKQSVPAKSSLGAMMQWQHYLFYRTFLAPFYEHNIIQLIDPILNGKTLQENSVGLSLRYYFKKISIPAIILEYAHNIDDESDHVHLNIGLSL